MLESDDLTGEYKRFGIPCVKGKERFLQELSQPCSRFAFDIRRVQSDFNSALRASRRDPLSDQELMIATDVPANWQAFVHFLSSKRIVTPQGIVSPFVRNDVPKITSALLFSDKDEGRSDGRPVECFGFGASYDDTETAMSKAVGELLERHFSSIYRAEDLAKASYEDLRHRRFGPLPLDIFSLNGFLPSQEEQWPQFCRDSRKPIGWVQGENLTRGTRAYIPAQLVYWNYRLGDEMVLADLNTSGAAGHFTKDEAVLSALLELIQRDGFMIHWLMNAAPSQIDQRTITDADTIDFLNRLKEANLEVHLLDTTTDIGVPTCTCVIIDGRNDTHSVYVAASCGFSVQDAIFSALLESVVVFNAEMYQSEPYILKEDYQPFVDPSIGRFERLRVWRTQKMVGEIRPFLQGPLISEATFMRGGDRYVSVAERLAYIQKMFAALGDRYDIYLHEFNDPLLDTVGYHVVQAIVPAIMAMYLTENMATLAAERLTSVPEKLGWKTLRTFRSWPHPFP